MVIQNGNTSNLAVLLIGLAGVICLLSVSSFDVGKLIVGVTLLLLLRGYRGNMCETKQGRLMYSAIWAVNFLMAVSFLLPVLLLSLPLGLLQFRTALFGNARLFSVDFLMYLVVWLVTLLICKAYYDRKAVLSLAPNTVMPSATTHP